MTVPVSTYRLQVSEAFTLFAAADVTGYLSALGIGTVYLSPILTSEPGSTHGYGVTDYSTVDPSRGGKAGLAAVSAAAHARGMGVLVDIVPNHMGASSPSHNGWWWDLLASGRKSRYAEAFDIDWECGERIRIPVLSSDIAELSIVDGELEYEGLRFPIAEGTADDAASPAEVHARQHYELVASGRADAELNYRRFFAISSLPAIRVEVPWVFDESHAEIRRWVEDGLVDGLRVDHPDGLLDPGGYLDELARLTGTTYVVVEKILIGRESLPPHWQAAGTTGYDALADIDRVLVDPKGREPLERAARGDSMPVTWADLIHETKREVADGILRSEIVRIARAVPDIPGAPDAIAELAACFPVYRSYLPYGEKHLRLAEMDAKRRRPELSETFDALMPRLADPSHPAAQRLQQTTGAVMAKGVEDSAFYRYARLTSLNEVGGDPSEFSIDLAEFHARQQTRMAAAPNSLTALSTHDTKRSEDVRARIKVLSEIPNEWLAVLSRLRNFASLGDAPLEDLLWQAIVGSWPASPARLHAYATKAAREAGNFTNWARPNERFEQAVHALVESAFRTAGIETMEEIVARVRAPGWSNSLAAKLVQLTAPGVPDVYQGSELWDDSLVDPDNRRPVDFDKRRQLLAAIDTGWLPEIDESGAAKLLVTSRALRLRRDQPALFRRYAGLTVVGDAADHLVAFDRGGAITLGTRLPVGLELRGGWGNTVVLLPRRSVRNVITGERFEGGELRVADVLSRYPVALLA